MLLLIVVYSTQSSTLPLGALQIKVVDGRTGKELPNVQICLKEAMRCVISLNSGQCQLDSINPGFFTITSSSEYYDSLTEYNVEIKSGSNNRIIILNSKVLAFPKMTIVSKSYSRQSPSQTTSITHLSNIDLNNTAGTANDVNRAIAVLPSVVSGNTPGYTNTLLVRGGQVGENVYLVDGIPFRDASHFSAVNLSGGVIGFVNSALVRDLDFYAGGFPASMEPRISSVIDMHLRGGSQSNRKYQVDLNMSGLSLTTEGPFANSSASYLIGGRFVDVRFLSPFLGNDGTIKTVQYGDAVVKLHFKLNKNNILNSVSVFAHDFYEADYPYYLNLDAVPSNEKRSLTNIGTKLSWERRLDHLRNVFSMMFVERDEQNINQVRGYVDTITAPSSMFNISNYQRTGLAVDSLVNPTDTMNVGFSRIVNGQLSLDADNRWQVFLKNDCSFFVGEHDLLNVGIGFDREVFHVSKKSAIETESFSFWSADGVKSDTLPETVYKTHAFNADSTLPVDHFGGYLEYIWNAGQFKTVVGLRGDYYSVLTDFGISPRFGMTLRTDAAGIFNMGGGLFYQFPSEFSGMLHEILAINPNQSAPPAPLLPPWIKRVFNVIGRQLWNMSFPLAWSILLKPAFIISIMTKSMNLILPDGGVIHIIMIVLS